MASIYQPRPIGGAKATMIASTALTNAGGGSSGTVLITSPPTTGTAGVALSLSGTVSPTNTAVNVGLSSSATVAPGSFTSATVSGEGWTASLTPASAGTWYIWAESGFATPAVSAAVTISAGQTGLNWTQISTSTTGGVTALADTAGSDVNLGTPVVHGSAVTPDVTITLGSGSTCNGAVFWFDTSATNQSSTGGTVASGTVNAAAGIPGGYVAAFNPGVAPAAAGTFYGKVSLTVTGTNSGTYVFASQVITVT